MEMGRNNFRITPGALQIPVNVVGSSTFGRYPKTGSALTYNMFISDGWLVNTAGYKLTRVFQDSEGDGNGRGFFHSTRGDFLIAVINSDVYKLGINLEPIFLGQLDTDVGEVFMDENLNSQICIVDGQNAWIYNYAVPALTIHKQTLDAGLIPGYVTYHNTNFLFGNVRKDAPGAYWYAYRFNNAGSPPADQLIIKVGDLGLFTKPDFALAVKRLPGQANNVLVFGSTVCEIWTHIGGNQNYRRNSSVNIDYGCISVSTIATCDQYTAWLAINEDNSPIILYYNAEGIQRISTDGIDYLMDNLVAPQESTALFYTQDGHLFYQLTFFNPADDLTLLYDFNTKQFFNLSDYDDGHHPARKIVYFKNTPYFISLKEAALYKTDTSLTTYNKNLSSNPLEWNPLINYPIDRTRICDGIEKPDSGRFIANTFVLTIDQGNDPNVTGLSLAQAGIPAQDFGYQNPTALTYQPRVDMAISKDSGTTWSNYVSRGLNPIGKRKNILSWGNLGNSNDLTIKLKFIGLSSFIINNGIVEVY